MGYFCSSGLIRSHYISANEFKAWNYRTEAHLSHTCQKWRRFIKNHLETWNYFYLLFEKHYVPSCFFSDIYKWVLASCFSPLRTPCSYLSISWTDSLVLWHYPDEKKVNICFSKLSEDSWGHKMPFVSCLTAHGVCFTSLSFSRFNRLSVCWCFLLSWAHFTWKDFFPRNAFDHNSHVMHSFTDEQST